LTDVQRQGQGFALDPPKAGGLWKPFYYHIVKVKGLGPWWVQGEALALPNEGSFLTAVGIISSIPIAMFRRVRLLASTDFALSVLLRLAGEPERRRSTDVLAREVGVPRNHLHKIVQDLAAMGLVRTQRGRAAG